MRTILTITFLLFTVIVFAQKVTHEVTLKNGEVLQLEVYQQNSKKISYWTSQGKKGTILKSEIEDIKELTGSSTNLEENYIDEFTGNSVKRTSWETLNMTMQFTAYYRISKINDHYYLNLKMMLNKVFSISKDQEFMFKLDDGTVLKFLNLEYTTTCRGCGAKGFSGSEAQGIEVSYPVKKEQIDILINNRIEKLRIYTNDGYLENEVSEKRSKEIIANFSSLIL